MGGAARGRMPPWYVTVREGRGGRLGRFRTGHLLGGKKGALSGQEGWGQAGGGQGASWGLGTLIPGGAAGLQVPALCFLLPSTLQSFPSQGVSSSCDTCG